MPNVVGSVATSRGNADAAKLSNLPSSIIAGELLEVVIATDGDETITFISDGWTKVAEGTAAFRAATLSIWMRIADGSEGATVEWDISSRECWAASARRIENHGVSLLPGDITLATFETGGSNKYPNSPNCNPGIRDNYLFRTYVVLDNWPITGAPSGYTHDTSFVEAPCGSSDRVGLGVAGRQRTASADDPGSWGIQFGSNWITQTIAVPSPGTAPTVTVDTVAQKVAGGAVLQLMASAPTAARYAWTASPDVGVFSDATVEDPTWTAPFGTASLRVVTLTLTVAGRGNTASANVTIRVSRGALLSVTVGGVRMPLLDNSFKMRDRIAERSTADFRIRDDAGGCPLCVANFGTPVTVTDPAGLVFEGFVYTVTTRRLAPSGNTDPPTQVHVVRLMDNHYRADKRLVAASYRDMTSGEIVLALWTATLKAEGVQAAPNPAGAVHVGVRHKQVVFNYVPVSTALDRLAESANYVWSIGHDRTLRFQPRNASSAPWTLTGSDIQGIPTLRRHATKYRNQQFVTGSRITTDPQVEKFRGDGVQQTFVLGYPLASVPELVITHPGNVDETPTLGIRGLDDDTDWYWSKGSNEISQQLSDVALSDTHVLKVTYEGLSTVVAIVGLRADQQTRALLEGTTTGIIDSLAIDRNLDTAEAAIEFANAQLVAFGETSLELRFTTRRGGLAAGQRQNINLPNMVKGRFLITEVQVRDRSAQWLEYRVRAINSPITGSWAKFWKEAIAKSGDDILENIAEDQDLLLVGDGGFEEWDWTEATTQVVHQCPIPATSLHPASSLLPC